VGERHVAKSMAYIPDWWGVKVFRMGPRGGVAFEVRQPLKRNAEIDAIALAELLWRPEVSLALSSRGASKEILRRPRAYQYRALADSVPLDELRDLVRACLKARQAWRGRAQPL
jgi:hypothetical protein